MAVAQQQKAKSLELRAALSLAKLYQSTNRAADAHAVLTPALEGFSPTPELPDIEEAQRLLAALAETDEVKNATVLRQRRLKLQTSYGQALQWSKGYVAVEATAAFKRAQELAAGLGDDAERFKVHHGQWVGCYMRAELSVAQEIAETLLRGAEIGKRVQETAIAQSMLGLTLFMQGAFADARALQEKTLRHRDSNALAPIDTEVGAKINLAYTVWVSGDFVRARNLINESVARAVELRDPPSQCTAYSFKSRFEMLRGDAEGACRAAEHLLEVSQQHEMKLFLASADVYGSWARTRLRDHPASAKQFQQALVAYVEQGDKIWLPLYQGRLAEIEADGEGIEEALARIDGALALAAETREHWSDSLLHRIRGEILLNGDPVNTALAEEAFLTAINVAQRQRARTFELQAALALGKLYQRDSRATDVHAVLAPALEAFAPTPELPEIEEAKALLATLAKTNEVKSAVAARERRLQLQTRYGLAVSWSRGFAADETKAAFARARDLSAGTENLDERFTSLYGQWITSLTSGEIGHAQEIAETFLHEAQKAARVPETVAALRYLGLTHLSQGHFVEARSRLEQVLMIYDPNRDRHATFRFGTDSLASATIYLAFVYWQFGDFRRARELSDEAVARALESAHDATLANTWLFKVVFEMSRDDAEATLRATQALFEVSERLKLPIYLAGATVDSCWARARIGGGEASLAELRQAFTAYTELGNKFGLPFIQGKLAEIEAELEGRDAALVRIEDAVLLARETGQHQYDPFLHCVRGEILLNLSPIDTKGAEESFLSSIASARKQRARTDDLHASLKLAKHYQATGRPSEAIAVLEPALEGFTRTPELPEIEEAQALLDVLRSEATRR
jgi:predicted ATPase